MLAQTFTDFELLVLDDGSTDRSVEIARAYERLDSRVRVVVNEHNIGQFENRNRAAELARGSLLKYHDSDDLMYPHCLAVMVAMLQSEPTAAFGLSSGGAWPGGACPMLLTPGMAYQREFFGGGLFMCGPAGALFRADAFRALGGFPLSGPHSDTLFWLQACAEVPFVLFPADLFWYRLHDGQHWRTAVSRHDEAQLFKAFWAALDKASCPLTAEEREQAKRNRAFLLAKKLSIDLRRGRWRLAMYPMAKFRPECGRLAAVPSMATPRHICRDAPRRRRRVPNSSVGPAARRHEWAGVTTNQAGHARLKSILGPRLTVLARCVTRGLPMPRWGNLRRVEPFSKSFGSDRGKPVDRSTSTGFSTRTAR